MNEYTRAEVALHNRMGDIWFIIHKYVYNVTEFIYEHPGGQEAHLRVAGKDASECFDEVGHSDEAEMLMKRFRIGVVKEGGHPGGEEVLLEQAGKDATEPFEDVGHSSDARELMAKYKIGELVESERKKIKEPVAKDWSTDNNTEDTSSWKSWLIPVTLGILATIVYRFLTA
ncbi:cytochrome b5 isoform X1 [Thrips palmi]|uniref:Cytochrome b5 isoform X1 n=1 Tax=Thrips palmi TaxID=161013 RepID=A0A6P8ZA82_THRPL|nr:cytochrome b5 isoform X1 [Thrips palmi]